MSDEKVHLKTILFVFDELDLIEATMFWYVFLTNDFEVNVQQVDNLIEAQSLLDEAKPDLMIIHHKIENYKGIEFVRSLRNKAAFKTLPIIMYIPLGYQGYVDEARRAGVDDVLTMIVPPRDILALVQSLLV